MMSTIVSSADWFKWMKRVIKDIAAINKIIWDYFEKVSNIFNNLDGQIPRKMQLIKNKWNNN